PPTMSASDPVDDLVAGQRAGQEADIVGGADKADDLGRNAAAGELQTDQGRQNCQRRVQQDDGQQYLQDGRQDFAHASPSTPPPASSGGLGTGKPAGPERLVDQDVMAALV